MGWFKSFGRIAGPLIFIAWLIGMFSFPALGFIYPELMWAPVVWLSILMCVSVYLALTDRRKTP